MLIRRLSQLPGFIAGDKTRLKELLHPDREYPFKGRYSLAHAIVAPGQTTLKHRLATDEVYYILQGTGEMHVDDEVAEVQVGDAIDIPPASVQWITNVGETELIFLCIVDPAWRAEDEKVIE